MLILKDCLKTYTADQDKARDPAETVALATRRLTDSGARILAEIKRIDTGRLGIPVYLSVCGDEARRVMPTRKQMGKGATPDQAQASALMELTERYSFFTFWDRDANFTPATWSEAEALWPGRLMPLADIAKSVGDDLPEADCRRAMDLVRWRFAPVTDVTRNREVMAPLDWFKTLNEFNGSSAGNTLEESLLQGACELVERHVCALAARDTPELPTIDPSGCADPVLAELMRCFTDNGVTVLLKDLTMGMPAPTVAALCMDPSTFPEKSEIVFTAGTASSPAKAAIRALTEVAQLGGDFETGANYEASGLPKYTDPGQFQWLAKGPTVPLDALPDLENDNIRLEIETLCQGLAAQDLTLYSADITNPAVGLPANYNLVPGFQFRERSAQASLGLFAGRKLAEEAPENEAAHGLKVLDGLYPEAHFTPFFRALLALRTGDIDSAAGLFAQAEPLQHDNEDRALAAFYQAYALSQREAWDQTREHLDRAVALCPEVKEYFNLRGVAKFKSKDYEAAAEDFQAALNLDSGSAMDLANLGLCYKFMGQNDKAAHCLGSALELDSELDFARRHLDKMLGD